ncbi:MAG: ribosome biogenesis protein [Promethearchaeota archaeon]|nr:MAG: ribosome biogenesis protein [Candidatus Lokiarchaeota archaeon]
MGKNIRKCKKCGRYTMNKKQCPEPTCDGETKNVNPPSFSIQDKYGAYRRKFKKDHGIM